MHLIIADRWVANNDRQIKKFKVINNLSVTINNNFNKFIYVYM